ncbi:hypothetical protein QBC38DRAFT_206197 [Podospora fimiseda]|uniref:F-box domain-containing protein n=1 Tax=Podospora fimiseda TaxID=252190 RepID=A0AAN7GYC3_9PEZI|nr:hypothetical protein QBC38DRAFT_206197 [Podospora fimiseda]
MGFVTTITMKFFKKKDKRQNGAGQSWTSPGNGNGGGYSSGDGLGQARSASGYRSYGPSPSGSPDHIRSRPTHASAITLARLPAPVLERIFTFVCPHSKDESYETCEQSSVEDACMLCDLRDLAHCVAVCRKWRDQGIKLLYHSIRIDSVHYCDLEAILAERRKRRSFFDRNGEPEDPAQGRLKLLCRTLREDPVRRGALVQYLKMPYMLRETSQADLARTIAVTPNLHFVDLPEGLYTDEPSCMTLRLEVQARCLELRKMTYMNGSERSLQALASGRVWTKLQVLELIRIDMDPTMLRHVLGNLANLRALKISQTESVIDETLAWNDALPPFPPLEEFILTDVPYVTVEGLKGWLALPEARQALKVLTLNRTGVKVWTLHEIVVHVPQLKVLSVVDKVSAAIPVAAGSHNIPPLNSRSLETLHFEITAATSSPKYSGVTGGYYSYLAGSLLSGGLPNLLAVYVRDSNFPDMLLGLPPPTPAYAEGGIARPSSSRSNSPFSTPSTQTSFGFASPPASNPFYSTPTKGGMGGHRPQQSSLSSLGSASPFSPNPRFSSNNPFANIASWSVPPAGGSFMNLPAKLEVFTKGDDDQLGWSFVQVGGNNGGGDPFQSGRGGSGSIFGGPLIQGGVGVRRGTMGGSHSVNRPMSSYGLGADIMGGSTAGWSSGAGARRSTLIGGAGAGGGFLAVPNEAVGGSLRGRMGNMSGGLGGGKSSSSLGIGGDGGIDEWPRPKSSNGESKRERLDLWR